jgi:lipopolysaccharide export system permease protein|tara:strand:- start:990 stop:2126 length:1137 start_codon:yes stop_codon:yes gene_type:complete
MKKIIYKNLVLDCTKFFLLTIFTISIIIWVLQAVNYLDFVVEDGHGFFVYFNYTLLSFPKIFSRIYPFAIFISFSYILLKYEEKNELIIFWNFGIKKIDFINFFIKFSFLFMFLSLLLNALIVPLTQDKARSFIRSSNLDLFESMLKPKKFVDIIRNLTIYYDEKSVDGKLKNIFLNDKLSLTDSQTTFAKTGIFKVRENKKILVLYDGKTINNVDGKIYEFTFNKTDFNISRFNSTAIIYQKTQETSTVELVQCLLIMNNFKKIIGNKTMRDINNCTTKNLKNIYEELYSRLIKPLYITFLIAVTLLFILKSKSNPAFKSYKFKIYLLGFIFIIFFETSSKFISINFLQNSFISILPIIFLLMIYLYFLKTLKTKKK